MPEVTFARERIHDVFVEIQPLLERHWTEIARYPDIPLAPDYEIYKTAERAGRLRIYTARKDSMLVGYAVFFLVQAPHYKQSKQAQQDILFVDVKHRRGRTGWRLVSFADEQLTAEGVQLVQQHVKNAHPALGALLQRQGYEAVETIYMRRLR